VSYDHVAREGGSGRRQVPGATAPGRAARGQRSGVSMEGAWYGKMVGGLARGNKKKNEKENGPGPRQQCYLLII
jgi:hypothetical protein